MQTAAILLTVLVVCGFAVPKFFSEETVKNWPAWAQRRLVLGPNLQGGASVLLGVDQHDVRTRLLKSLQREVGRTLHDARINLVNLPVVRGDSVEVRLHEGDFPAGFAELRELSQPFNGVRSVDVVDACGGLVRLTPTDAAMLERTRQTIEHPESVVEGHSDELGRRRSTDQTQCSGLSLGE